MTLRHRIPWIPTGFPGFPQDSKDSHEIPGFPRDSQDSHRIPGIPIGFPRFPGFPGFPWDSESRESAVSPLLFPLFTHLRFHIFGAILRSNGRQMGSHSSMMR